MQRKYLFALLINKNKKRLYRQYYNYWCTQYCHPDFSFLKAY